MKACVSRWATFLFSLSYLNNGVIYRYQNMMKWAFIPLSGSFYCCVCTNIPTNMICIKPNPNVVNSCVMVEPLSDPSTEETSVTQRCISTNQTNLFIADRKKAIVPLWTRFGLYIQCFHLAWLAGFSWKLLREHCTIVIPGFGLTMQRENWSKVTAYTRKVKGLICCCAHFCSEICVKHS